MKPILRLFSGPALAMLLGLALTSPVLAHGSNKPQHGGVVTVVGETVLELVQNADGIQLFVVDEDEDVPSSAVTAKLTVSNGASSTEMVLQPGPGNQHVGKGIKLAAGATVAVQLTDNKTRRQTSANFAIK